MIDEEDTVATEPNPEIAEAEATVETVAQGLPDTVVSGTNDEP